LIRLIDDFLGQCSDRGHDLEHVSTHAAPLLRCFISNPRIAREYAGPPDPEQAVAEHMGARLERLLVTFPAVLDALWELDVALRNRWGLNPDYLRSLETALGRGLAAQVDRELRPLLEDGGFQQWLETRPSGDDVQERVWSLLVRLAGGGTLLDRPLLCQHAFAREPDHLKYTLANQKPGELRRLSGVLDALADPPQAWPGPNGAGGHAVKRNMTKTVAYWLLYLVLPDHARLEGSIWLPLGVKGADQRRPGHVFRLTLTVKLIAGSDHDVHTSFYLGPHAAEALAVSRDAAEESCRQLGWHDLADRCANMTWHLSLEPDGAPPLDGPSLGLPAAIAFVCWLKDSVAAYEEEGDVAATGAVDKKGNVKAVGLLEEKVAAIVKHNRDPGRQGRPVRLFLVPSQQAAEARELLTQEVGKHQQDGGGRVIVCGIDTVAQAFSFSVEPD